MPAPSLPVSRLINVAVNLTPSAAATQSLSELLILGSSPVIDTTERYRTYSTIDEVAADFGLLAPEYLAAVLWFEQVPQPSQLLIGRWAASATNGRLNGAPRSQPQQAMSVWNAISNGRFIYAVDGGSPVTTSPINLTGAANLPAVAASISALTPGLTFTWNPSEQRFEAVSATTGSASQVAFLTNAGVGTDLGPLLGMTAADSGAYRTQGIVAESAASAVALFDLNYGQKFYGVTVLGAVNTDHLAIAQFVEAGNNKHVYFITTQEAGVLVAATTTDIAYQMKALGYKRTWVQYSSTNPYAAVSAAARILTVDYQGNATVITLMYKQEPGIVAESLNSNQADALEAKNCNVFVNYNNDTAIVEQGKTASGLFLDIITTTDWLSLTVQAALYNLLYTTATKIPQTDAGSQLMVNAIESVCDQGVRNGMLAPGVWQTTGFGQLNLGDYLVKGYYVYAQKVSQQNLADRQARKAPPMQVAAKLAGAVHTIAMTINVNQ